MQLRTTRTGAGAGGAGQPMRTRHVACGKLPLTNVQQGGLIATLRAHTIDYAVSLVDMQADAGAADTARMRQVFIQMKNAKAAA